ncbi:MAG TPA: hypothetical protein VES88_12320 [Gemmatimonadaceae bacterium]|nr:hypothetical protein [Gemmatimonadaceae bacterium]
MVEQVNRSYWGFQLVRAISAHHQGRRLIQISRRRSQAETPPIADQKRYANAGLGIGRDFGRYITLEIDVFHSPLETPASYFARGSNDVYFKTPITTLTAAARVTLPFMSVVFVGAGGGVLWFDNSDDDSGSFTTATNMWIVGVQKTITRRVFTRVEGHHRADRHAPFNGVNGEIIGVVGFRF